MTSLIPTTCSHLTKFYCTSCSQQSNCDLFQRLQYLHFQLKERLCVQIPLWSAFFSVLGNGEEWCFLFWNIFSRPTDNIQVFVTKIDDVTNSSTHDCNATQIENTSENIGWVLFKLASDNLHQVRHKTIPSMLLQWQPFFAAGST